MQYREEIDGLRAIAVLAVMLFHGGFAAFGGGYVGVDVFFVISGYLITTLIVTDLAAGRFSLARFYERRIRRLLPALYLVTVVCIPFAWALIPADELQDFYESVAAVALFASNLLFWQESGYFATAAELKPLLHTWSLAVEEQYYLFFPLLVLFVYARHARWLLPALAGIAVVSFALAVATATDRPVASFYLLPMRLWELMIGSVVALVMLDQNRARSLAKLRPGLREALGMAGLGMIGYAVATFDAETPFPGMHALVPTVGTALIIVFATRGTLLRHWLGSRSLVRIGLISYSAYLWHYPLLVFARHYTIGTLDTGVVLGLLALALLLARLSWQYVEQPFRRGTFVAQRPVYAAATLAPLVLVAVGLLGLDRNGPLYDGVAGQESRLAEIRVLDAERRELVGYEQCHFSAESGAALASFLGAWDCWDDMDNQRYVRIPYVVAGDSHAADIAIALKTNGYLPLQIGGAGCSLDPAAMTEVCRRIYAELHARVQRTSYFRFLILANRYSPGELSAAAIRRTVDYWEKFGLKIMFVTGMPEFPAFKKAVLKDVKVAPDASIAELSERLEVVGYLADRGVTIINRREIFCAITGDCSFRNASGELLLVDYGHLSPNGATEFGTELVRRLRADNLLERSQY